jgi:LuxR family quorum sensing-dependent transcriptional regulator
MELQLGTELLAFTVEMDGMASADVVLDRLHETTTKYCQIGVLGAGLFPLRPTGDVERGKTVFVHKSLPKEWWDEYVELSRTSPPTGLMLARSSLAPFTMTEMIRMFEPVGIDRWPCELALKYGIRDVLTCPVGGRWVVAYWSRQVMSQILSAKVRAMLFMAATFAAIRLQQLAPPSIKRIGRGVTLTPRELAVLRSLSQGRRVKETAERLGLGEETVRSHIKKAQDKLEARDRTHAVAQALRRQLIA